MKQVFEGFDFTDFWDDNYYARKKYISDAPTDDLIADVEKELGYKEIDICVSGTGTGRGAGTGFLFLWHRLLL